jgi:preprotein translocase subunit SecF
MRKLLSFLVILVVVIGVVGFARGWFTFASQKGSGGTNMELHVDDQKIEADVKGAGEKAKQGLQSLEKEAENALHGESKK